MSFDIDNITAAPDPNGPIRRVLIIGVSGYLGAALATGLRDEFEVFGTYNNHPVRIDGVTSFKLNCIHGGEILDSLNRYKPEAIIYCGGFSSHQLCNENPGLAESLHFKAPTVFFKILPMVLRFIYFSTDEVMGLASGTAPYSEDVAAAPTSILGKTRRQGESACLGSRFTAVFRLGEVFGEPFGWNTSQSAAHGGNPNEGFQHLHWLDEMQSQLARGRSVALSKNVVKSYLYVGDMIRAVKLYLRKAPIDPVLYNLAGRTPISQLDFGRLVCEKLGYNPALVKSVVKDLSTDLSLSPQKFETDYSFEFQSIEDSVDEFAERLRTGHTKSWA